jgi:1-acyl-sn-glycerol-3-phosphate acyltransferase
VLYRTLELTVAPALRAVYRPLITGLEHVPHDGAVILAGNHISFADEIFTPLAARRQVCYLAKSEYFTTPGPRGRAMAAFFGGLGLVPVDRDATRAAAASIDVSVDVLRQGRAFGIYPEGTRSPDGRLYKFRTGVARVALRSGAPVVPVGVVGTRAVQPPGTRQWRRAGSSRERSSRGVSPFAEADEASGSSVPTLVSCPVRLRMPSRFVASSRRTGRGAPWTAWT